MILDRGYFCIYNNDVLFKIKEHALIGGMIGAALVKAGPKSLMWKGITKTVTFIFISPTVGLALGFLIGIAVYWMFRRNAPSKVDHIFRKGQLLSATSYALVRPK